jgi:hypothetical protein
VFKVKSVETPEEFSFKLRRLHKLATKAACDEDHFVLMLGRAKAAGMTYKEGLEFVIREANGGAD